MNRMLLAGVVGGIVAFLLGGLIYMVLLPDMMNANAGSATGVTKDPPLMWSLILGNLFLGMLFAYIYERWASIRTLSTGAMAGAVIGLLMSAGSDFIMYGVTNLMTLNGVLMDIVVSVVMSAIVGGVVGWTLGYNRKD